VGGKKKEKYEWRGESSDGNPGYQKLPERALSMQGGVKGRKGKHPQGSIERNGQHAHPKSEGDAECQHFLNSYLWKMICSKLQECPGILRGKKRVSNARQAEDRQKQKGLKKKVG